MNAIRDLFNDGRDIAVLAGRWFVAIREGRKRDAAAIRTTINRIKRQFSEKYDVST